MASQPPGEETRERHTQKTRLLCSLVLEMGARQSLYATQGHRGSARFWSVGKRQERGENIRLDPLLGFPWGEGRAGQGEQSGLS